MDVPLLVAAAAVPDILFLNAASAAGLLYHRKSRSKHCNLALCVCAIYYPERVFRLPFAALWYHAFRSPRFHW